MENKVTILGARGSVPVSGERFVRYGCATTCFMIEMGGEIILVDAGTGILNLPREILQQPELKLLLTHAHYDHLVGLPMCPYLFQSNVQLHLYSAKRDGLTAKSFLKRMFSPPLWPVGPDELPGKVVFHELHGPLQLGAVHVDTMEGLHPGGVSLLRFTCGDHCVVVTTDCTITDEQLPGLAAFARDCDLLLCDGQYSEGEWVDRSAFGHSKWTAAAELYRVSGAKAARIIHHDPDHTDAELDAAAGDLLSRYPHCGFAQEGEVIYL